MKKLTSLILILLIFISLAAQSKTSQQVIVSQKISASGEVDFVTDSFTESSDTILSSHTGALGATWTQHTSYATNSVTVDAATDRIYLTADPASYHASGTPPSADYCVEAEMTVRSIISANSGIVWRVDTAANTMMLFQINNGTGWRLRKIVAGTQTTIGSEDTTTNIPSVGQSRTMKACSVGNTHTAYINGTLLSGVGGSDSSVTSAGKTGVRFVGAQSSTTGYHLDNFRAFTP